MLDTIGKNMNDYYLVNYKITLSENERLWEKQMKN